jgi:hypothetical protein
MDMDKMKAGYWAIATQKHLKSFTSDSSNIDEFDKLNLTGKMGRFLGTIRGNTKINNMKKLEKMANTVGISPSELNHIIMPMLEKSSDKKVEILKDSIGSIIGIEEYVFSNDEVLSITGQAFEDQNPSNIQRISIETMDETKKVPYLQDELANMLVNDHGFAESDIMLSFALQEQFKLIQRLKKTKSKEPIISNEYVWGANHSKIAFAISEIEFDKKQNLRQVIDAVQNKQGIPTELLPNINPDLFLLAKKTGMLNPITINSNRGIQKEFVFSPNMLEPLTYNDDILDDVKLLLASIRFGENYTPITTIQSPEKFLKYLISHGDIGPHEANSTDYMLLEKKGIVRIVEKTKSANYGFRSGYCLELIRTDVAREALKIIQSPSYNLKVSSEINSFEQINDAGSFLSAEEIRVNLAEPSENVKEAEEYLSRVLRDELI